MQHLFYINRNHSENLFHIDQSFHCQFWQPRLVSMVPDGVNKFSARVWWLFHYLRLFANRKYGIFLIFDNEKLIHRSFIFPRYFRFPFMSTNDLQIGDTFTDPNYRGKGLATFAIQEIAKKYGENRKIWYLVACDNTASIRAIEKAGFTCVGTGEKIKRFGIFCFRIL